MGEQLKFNQMWFEMMSKSIDIAREMEPKTVQREQSMRRAGGGLMASDVGEREQKLAHLLWLAWRRMKRMQQVEPAIFAQAIWRLWLDAACAFAPRTVCKSDTVPSISDRRDARAVLVGRRWCDRYDREWLSDATDIDLSFFAKEIEALGRREHEQKRQITGQHELQLISAWEGT